jgi:hypothetical protein
MFAYDVAMQFPAFLRGDRSLVRWYALEALRVVDAAHVMQTLASGPTTPGEYIFAYVMNAVGGPAAIIAFQIVLFLLSLACLCNVAQVFPWRFSVLVIGTVYTLLPHNLVFTHQFVTEAVATPLVVFCVYFFFRFSRSQRRTDALLCGLAMGAAIFVRPPLMLIVPSFLLVHLLYVRYLPKGSWRAALLICGVAILPMLSWTTAYTFETGRIGYTSGVANLAWNLRSKVFLVYSRNDLEQPEALRRFKNYPSLYNNNDGISLSEFAEMASPHPILFAEVAVSDALIFLGRGDISKVFIDYLSTGDTAALKDWRVWWSKDGAGSALELLLSKSGSIFVIVPETILSLITLLCSLGALVFCCYCLIHPNKIATSLGKQNLAFVLVLTCIFLAVFAGAQLVDQAQGRLRHPAEACILLLLGFAIWYFRKDLFSDGGVASTSNV